MFYKTLTAFCLLITPLFAEIKVDESYQANHPIVVECEIPEVEKQDVIYEWTLPQLKDDKGLRTIFVDNNSKFYGWASPGTYDIDCTAVIQYKVEIEVVIRDPEDPNNRLKFKFKVIPIVQRIEIKKYSATFTVEGLVPDPAPEPDPVPDPVPDPEPDPEPDPVPDPEPDPEPDPIPVPINDPISATGFHVLIVEETADRVNLDRQQVYILQSSIIQKMTEEDYNGHFRQTDDDSILVYEDQRWVDAIQRDRDSLPWIIISNDQKWYEGPLPKNINETIKLLRKYGPR